MNNESNATFSASIVGDVATSTVTYSVIVGDAAQTNTYTHTAVLPKK